MPLQRRLIAVCSGALFVPLVAPLLLGRVFTRDDLAALHLPFRYLYREALRAGDSFLWTSAYRSGFYLHGEGEAGLAHPLHLAIYRLLPLGPAFNVEIVASYVAMFAGTLLLLQKVGISAEAAWFGAMVFTFSGFNLFNLMHVNHIAAVAHVPWLLLAAYVLLTSPVPRARALAFGGVAVVFGSQLLVGNPQYVWLTMIALGWMTFCLRRSGSLASIWPLGTALALGLLVGAVQWLPTLDFITESTRLAWSLDERLSFSLLPLNLLQLWSPFALQFRIAAPPDEAQMVHEFIVYNGAFCTVAIAWLAMRWREQRRKGMLAALLAFALFTLILAFGRYGGVYPLLSQLPGLRTLRAPARHLVLFQLALSGIAAVVFEDLLGLMRRRQRVDIHRLWPLAMTAAISIGVTGAAVLLARSSWPASVGVPLSSLLRSGPWAALVVCMTVTVGLAARGVGWSIPVLIVLAAFDQGLWGYSYAYRWGPIERLDVLAATAPVPPHVRQGDLIAPLLEGGPGNVAVLRGVRLATGYTGLTVTSVLDPEDPVTQRIAGVAWRETSNGWLAVQDSMPRARLVTVARASRAIEDDVRGADFSQIAIVDRPIDGLSGPPGLVRIVSDRPGFIVVETSAPGRQLLTLTERFHRGWEAAIDGQPAQAIPVYGDFLGSVVDGGRHSVTFTFNPASARRGFQLTLAGIVLTLMSSVLLWQRHERRGSVRRVEVRDGTSAGALRIG